MKKYLLTITLTIISILVTGYSAPKKEIDNNTKLSRNIFSSKIKDNYIIYNSKTIGKNVIRLYPEPDMNYFKNWEENFSKAIDYIKSNILVEFNIDSEEFQSYVKQFMFIDTGTEIDSQVIEFVKFMDYYENIEKNNKILNYYSADELNVKIADEEFLELLPIPANAQKTREPKPGDDISNVIVEAAASNGYNPSDAVKYAKDWWYKTNNDDYPYYTEYYGLDSSTNAMNDLEHSPMSGRYQSATKRTYSDCTNFVSQCLKAGGMIEKKSGLLLPYTKSENWYYSDSKPSYTWGAALNFYNHWSERAGVTPVSSNLQAGDVVSIDMTGDGDPDHTAIITKVKSTGSDYDERLLLTQHTYDRCETRWDSSAKKEVEYTLQYLYDKGYTIYGYEMDKATNN